VKPAVGAESTQGHGIEAKVCKASVGLQAARGVTPSPGPRREPAVLRRRADLAPMVRAARADRLAQEKQQSLLRDDRIQSRIFPDALSGRYVAECPSVHSNDA
jgi:hypothetical protein